MVVFLFFSKLQAIILFYFFRLEGITSGAEVIVRRGQCVLPHVLSVISEQQQSTGSPPGVVSRQTSLFSRSKPSHFHAAMLKSVVRAVGAAVRLSPAASTSTARALPLRCPALRSPGSATTRPFTRSLWMLNNNGASSGYRPKLFGSKALNPSVSCGCGALHTEGNESG